MIQVALRARERRVALCHDRSQKNLKCELGYSTASCCCWDLGLAQRTLKRSACSRSATAGVPKVASNSGSGMIEGKACGKTSAEPRYSSRRHAMGETPTGA